MTTLQCKVCPYVWTLTGDEPEASCPKCGSTRFSALDGDGKDIYAMYHTAVSEGMAARSALAVAEKLLEDVDTGDYRGYMSLLDECVEKGAKIEELKGCLRAIAEHEPNEVTKDAFAYDRMVEQLRGAAKAALGEGGGR